MQYNNMNDDSYINKNSVMNYQNNKPTPTAPMTENMMNQTVYPEIFYKLQPYIMMVCDQMESIGSMMPSQEMVENITDNIYDDVCQMYPDMAEYASSCENNSKIDSPDFGDFDRRFFRRRRRRGLFKDIIDILLLSELTRRRRRFY